MCLKWMAKVWGGGGWMGWGGGLDGVGGGIGWGGPHVACRL